MSPIVANEFTERQLQAIATKQALRLIQKIADIKWALAAQLNHLAGIFGASSWVILGPFHKRR